MELNWWHRQLCHATPKALLFFRSSSLVRNWSFFDLVLSQMSKSISLTENGLNVVISAGASIVSFFGLMGLFWPYLSAELISLSR